MNSKELNNYKLQLFFPVYQAKILEKYFPWNNAVEERDLALNDINFLRGTSCSAIKLGNNTLKIREQGTWIGVCSQFCRVLGHYKRLKGTHSL